jgi:hypothetical protein
MKRKGGNVGAGKVDNLGKISFLCKAVKVASVILPCLPAGMYHARQFLLDREKAWVD